MAISGSYSPGDEVVMQNAKVEVDLTPITLSAYSNVSSWGGEVAVSGGDTPTSQFFTFGIDGPIVLTGNRNSWVVNVTVLYTEAATDPFLNLYDKYADPSAATDGSACDVQWSPKGGVTGDYQFTTSGGKLTMVPPPQGTAAGTDPVSFTFSIECTSIVRSAVPV